MEEIWKELNRTEIIYMVSNTGKVKSVKIENNKIIKERFLKPHISKGDRNGYFCFKIFRKNMLLHRAIAICFIENIKKKPCVNHINGVKTDNTLKNLEWVTEKENVHHAWSKGLSYYHGRSGTAKKPVSQFDVKGNHIKDYESASQAARDNKILQQEVSDGCTGRRKVSQGYIWKYI